MKRTIVLGLVLAILAVGLTALADPINVGGSFTGSSSPINVGGSNAVAFMQAPSHANAYGLRAQFNVTSLSPINVGGS